MKYLIADLKSLANFLLKHTKMIALIIILDALVWLLITDKYTSFLHPRFWPFLLGATVIVLLFIGAIIFGKPMHANRSHSRTIIKTLVLLAPLFVLYTVVGQGMGVHAFLKKNTKPGLSDLAFYKDFAVQAPGEKAEKIENVYSILEVITKMEQLNGQRVIAEGLVYTDDNVPEGHMMLFRFAMFCCAADATPFGIVVKIGDRQPLKNESWAKVDGVLNIEKILGKDIPVIHADTVEEMEKPPPGAQYMFF